MCPLRHLYLLLPAPLTPPVKLRHDPGNFLHDLTRVDARLDTIRDELARYTRGYACLCLFLVGEVEYAHLAEEKPRRSQADQLPDGTHILFNSRVHHILVRHSKSRN